MFSKKDIIHVYTLVSVIFKYQTGFSILVVELKLVCMNFLLMFPVVQSPLVALTWWSKAQLSLVYLAANHQNLLALLVRLGRTCGSASVNSEAPQSVNDACGSK